jgi:hypothetical protein
MHAGAGRLRPASSMAADAACRRALLARGTLLACGRPDSMQAPPQPRRHATPRARARVAARAAERARRGRAALTRPGCARACGGTRRTTTCRAWTAPLSSRPCATWRRCTSSAAPEQARGAGRCTARSARASLPGTARRAARRAAHRRQRLPGGVPSCGVAASARRAPCRALSVSSHVAGEHVQ